MDLIITPIGSFVDNTIRTITVNPYEDVRIMKLSIYKAYQVPENISTNKYYLLYKNIILSEEKLVKFYNMRSGEEVQIGLLEDFLRENEVIVELFLRGMTPFLMYFIVNCNNDLSQIKSILNELVPNNLQMYDIHGRQLIETQGISDLNNEGQYYKIIITCDNRNVGESQQQTLDNCFRYHDQYLIRKYFKIFPTIFRRIDRKDNWKNDLLKKIENLRKIIGNSNDINFNQNFTNLAQFLIHSRFLFCLDIADQIYQLCSPLYEQIMTSMEFGIREYFCAVLHIAIITVIKSDQSQLTNKSIKNVIIDGLDIFSNYLNDNQNDWRFLMKLFLDQFLISNYNLDEMQQLFESRTEFHPIIKLKVECQSVNIEIPETSRLIEHIKNAVSIQIHVATDILYFIITNTRQQPGNEDIIERDQLRYCVIHIISSMNNMNILGLIEEGGFSKVHLCRNESNNKNFALKEPNDNVNLYNDILAHCQFDQGVHIKTDIELIYYNNKICIAMEYLPNKTLISHVEKIKNLHHDLIAKLSFPIILQVKEIHDKGIIHGDINGYNIVFDDQNEPIVIDFGQSICKKHFTEEQLKYHLCTVEHTLGRLEYIAPEVFKLCICKDGIEKIDIWSFGIVLYEMLKGRKVPRNYSINNIDCKELIIKLPNPIPDNLLEFLKMCLKIDPTNRSSASNLLLSKFLHDLYKDQRRQMQG